MSLKSIPNDELARLLKEVNGEASRPVKSPINSVHKDLYLFVSTFSIEPGAYLIPPKLIWQLYKTWSPQPIQKANFLKFFATLLQHHTNGDWLINRGSLLISAELEKELNSRVKFKIKYDSQNKHFTNFLKKHIIEDGGTWVPISLLFETYRTWVKRIRKANTLGPEQFENFCRHYLKFTESNPETKVAINLESIKWPKSKHLDELRNKVPKKQK